MANLFQKPAGLPVPAVYSSCRSTLETMGLLKGSIDAIEADAAAAKKTGNNGFDTQLLSDEKPPPTRVTALETCG